MACENCNKKSKIIFGVAGCMALVGVIIIIVANVTGGESVKVGFEVENKQNPTLTVANGKGGLGYALHFKASEASNCDNIKGNTEVKAPDSSTVFFFGSCEEMQTEWEAKNDPPLKKLGHFFLKEENQVKVYGAYSITSTTSLWVVDSGEELGEAVGGIMAALGLLVVAVIVFVVSCILCCVGCCCMGPEAGKQGGGPPAQSYGQAQS